MALPQTVHGTAIAVGGQAALIRGASGSGKSDLALRCVGLAPGGLVREPVLLVADDRAILTRVGGDVVVSAPFSIAGQLEVRGVGIVEVPSTASAILRLVVDLVPSTGIVRMPEDAHLEIEGVSVRRVQLAAFEASAPLKLLLCLRGASTQNH